MSTVWDRFDGIVDAEKVVEARAKFSPIEAGVYTAVLEKLEPSESRSGLPMLKGQFRTTTNRVVFYNKVLQNLNYEWLTEKNIAEAVEFVSAIVGEEVEFQTLGQFAGLIDEIETGGEYKIKIEYNDERDPEHNFPEITVLEKELELPFD